MAARVRHPSLADQIRRADNALGRAVSRLAEGRPERAVDALDSVRHRLRHAHRAARALIGQPPADPESDEPPGPRAVLAVLGLEHRIGTTVVPLFDHQPRTDVSDALDHTLRAAHGRRDAILDRVIGPHSGGEGDDYADGMADTLGMFRREVEQVQTALATYQLTLVDQDRLRDALVRVQATRATVEAAYGGGERVAHAPASGSADLHDPRNRQHEDRS